MSAHTKAEMIRSIYTAIAGGDFATLTRIFADDVDMVQVGHHRISGSFQGRDALFGHFSDIGRVTDDFTMKPVDILVGDPHVAAMSRMTATIGDVTRQFQVVHIFRVEDGRVTALRSVPEDPYGMDEFFA